MEAVPLELRFRTPQVEVTDVSEHVMSPAEMAAKCTDILVFRYEKCRDNNRQSLDRDEEDTPKSSWEQAIRTRVTSQSQRELSREVRRLDKETDDVLKKKNDLSPALQRQLDRTYMELANGEHDSATYQWTLAQIDQQLRPVDPANTMFRAGHHHPVALPRKDEGKKHHKKKGKDKSRSRNKSKTKERKTSSSSKAKHGSYPPSNNVYLERVSLTAYFKRAPRPNVDVSALLQHKKRLQMMTQSAALHQPQDPRLGGQAQGQAQGPPFRPPPQGPHQGHPPGPGQVQRGPGPPPHHPNRPGPLPPNPANGAGGGGGGGKGKPPRVLSPSDSGSSDGSSSEDDSDADSDSGWSVDQSTSTGPTQTISSTGSSCRVERRDRRGRSHDRGHGHSKVRGKSRSKSRGKSRDKSRGKRGKVKGPAVNRSRSRSRGASRIRYQHLYHERPSAYGISYDRPFRMHQRPQYPYRRDSDPYSSPRQSFEMPPQPPRPSPPPATPIVVQHQTSKIEIEKIKDKAYLDGRADEKEKQRTLEEMAEDFPRPPSRSRVGVRHVVHTVESHKPRRRDHRETHRETIRIPRRRQEVDSDSSSSWSSSSEEVIHEYVPDYPRADYDPHRTRRGGAEYHHSRYHRSRSPHHSPRMSGAYRVSNAYETRPVGEGHRHRAPYLDTHHIIIDDQPQTPRGYEASDYSSSQDHDEPRRQMNPFHSQFEPRTRPGHGPYY
ncbi:hypothetical protein PG984_013746 [Apiospora sp. TS-2023a]